jgi:Leucine-rich repeat (LRR) protein
LRPVAPEFEESELNGYPHRSVLAVMASSVLAFAAGCDGSTDAVPDPPRPATVTVTPATAELTELGATVQLSAEVIDQYGNPMTGVSVTWTTGDVTVARVRAGVVTAFGEGETTIVASAGTAQGTSRITVRNRERAALVAFHEATDGPNWRNNDGWLTDLPLRAWYGVETDSDGRVVSLELRGVVGPSGVTRHGLAGPLPPELGDLSRLETLNLEWNELAGPIPVELARLSRLEELRLGNNRLTGPIPAELTRLSALEILLLNDNELTGPIPAELGSLSELLVLWLDNNDLSGPIPVELGNLANLWLLNLRDNRLTGTIPAELGDLAGLADLDLTDNRLSGSIPASLGGHPELTTLYLGGNDLTGPIPAEFGVFRVLRVLDLSHNQLTGPIPPGLGNLRTTRLLLNDNQLTGPIPDQLGFFHILTMLVLSNNRLTGPIPAELGDLDSLSWLDLGGNELTGPIPSELGRLDRLRLLDLADNELTGPIPLELGDLADLVVLYLHDNALTGPLPAELGELAGLTHLFLDNNDLEGPVPPGLGLVSRLEELGLTNNARMSGALPGALTGLGRLETLVAGGTELCAPSDADFQAWLEGVPKRRVRTCAGDPPMAYLTQAVQSREFPVPLIAGEGALLRVFPTARRANDAGIPASRVRLYLDGREAHVETVAGKSSPIPTEVTEGDLSASVNLEIDGSLS